MSDKTILATVDRTNKVCSVLFIALLVAWGNDFRPKEPAARDAVIALRHRVTQGRPPLPGEFRAEYRKVLNRQLDEARKRVETVEATTQTSRRKEDLAAVADSRRQLKEAEQRIQDWSRGLAAAAGSARAAQTLLAARREAAQDVRFRLFGVEFGVHGAWAPVAWLWLFGTGFAYLTAHRAQVIGAVAASHRRRLRLPLWAAYSGGWGRVTLLGDGLGLITAIGAALCFGISFLMVRSAIAGAWLVGPGSPNESRAIVVAVAVSVTAILTMLVLWSARVATQPSPTRRRVLLAIAMVPVAAYGVFVSLRRLEQPLQRSYLAPRFRRIDSTTEGLPSGFYAHTGTGLIYWIPPRGSSHILRQVPRELLQPLPSEQIVATLLPQVHESALVPFTRHFATVWGGEKRYEELAGFVRAALELPTRHPSAGIQRIQLVDLLARLGAKTGSKEHVARADEGVSQLIDSLDRTVARRQSTSFADSVEALTEAEKQALLPRRQTFTARRWESLLNTFQTTADRRKTAEDYLTFLRASARATPREQRLVQELVGRIRRWSEPSWMEDFNRDKALIRGTKRSPYFT